MPGASVRRIIAAAVLACASACMVADEPLPPTPRTSLFTPPQACVEPPQPPPEAVLHATDARACIPGRYTDGFPVEVTVSQGKVVKFRFYSQCEGRVYDAEPDVRDCIQKAVTSWRFDYFPPVCPETRSRADDVQTTQLYILPLARRSRGPELSSGIGVGCSAG
jgi:hypothetical protein